MMKYGKSISVEELFEPVLCALRCRWRLKQALLLLSLQTGQVAYWQNGEHSHSQKNEEGSAEAHYAPRVAKYQDADHHCRQRLKCSKNGHNGAVDKTERHSDADVAKSGGYQPEQY